MDRKITADEFTLLHDTIMTEVRAATGTWSLKVYNLLFEQSYYLDEEQVRGLINELIELLLDESIPQNTHFKISQLFSLMKSKKLAHSDEIFHHNKEKILNASVGPNNFLGPAIARLLNSLYEVPGKPSSNTPPPTNAPALKRVVGRHQRFVSHTPQPPNRRQ